MSLTVPWERLSEILRWDEFFMHIDDRKPHTVYVVTSTAYPWSSWKFGTLIKTDNLNRCTFLNGSMAGRYGHADRVTLAIPNKLTKLFYL